MGENQDLGSRAKRISCAFFLDGATRPWGCGQNAIKITLLLAGNSAAATRRGVPGANFFPGERQAAYRRIRFDQLSIADSLVDPLGIVMDQVLIQ